MISRYVLIVPDKYKRRISCTPRKITFRLKHSFYVLSEPMGSKAPALIGEMKRGWKEMITRSNIVLTCPAQGHPVPSFR